MSHRPCGHLGWQVSLPRARKNGVHVSCSVDDQVAPSSSRSRRAVHRAGGFQRFARGPGPTSALGNALAYTCPQQRGRFHRIMLQPAWLGAGFARRGPPIYCQGFSPTPHVGRAFPRVSSLRSHSRRYHVGPGLPGHETDGRCLRGRRPLHGGRPTDLIKGHPRAHLRGGHGTRPRGPLALGLQDPSVCRYRRHLRPDHWWPQCRDRERAGPSTP